MMQTLDIAEVARRTGLSSRALRFYEARGLVIPLRTAAGRRHYGAGELERLHRLIAFKRAGLSLADIKRLFDNQPVDLGALLRAQIAAIDAQSGKLGEARALLTSVLSRINHGAPVDAATFCALIETGDVQMEQENWKKIVDQYWSPEAQADWRERMLPPGNLDRAAFEGNHAKWKALSAKIEAVLPLDPASDEALALLREWTALLEPFTRVATPQMWESSRNMYANMDKWDAPVDAGFNKTVWDFIQLASQAHRAAGRDIGLVPAWMQPN